MSELSRRAKEHYIQLHVQGYAPTLETFANTAHEALGLDSPLYPDTVKHWAADENWWEAARQAMIKGGVYDSTLNAIDSIYARADEAKKPGDLASLARAYINMLDPLGDEALRREADRVACLRDKIDQTIPTCASPKVISSLSATWRSLMKMQRLDVDQEGVDVDLYLMFNEHEEGRGSTRRLSPEDFEEFKKCRSDWVYVLETYGWLKHTSRGAIKWVPYEYQKEMVRLAKQGKNIITKKSRQIGCSWTAAFCALMFILFYPDINVLILSSKEKYAIDFLRKVKFIFNRLPKFLKPQIGTNSQTLFSLIFRCVREGQTFTSESAIHSLTTTTDTGRGFSARLVIMDEAAFLPRAEETWTAVAPTTTHGGQLMVISTPNGVNNFYHRLWVKTEMGEETGFTPVIAYYKDCGYDEAWLKQVTSGMTVQQILQEYELQFVTAHNPFFDLNHLALCYYPDQDIILDAHDNNIHVKTDVNFTGVDTAGGFRRTGYEPDYNSIVTLNKYGVQIAAYHSRERLAKMAGKTITLENGDKVEVEGIVSSHHREYPGFLCVETNGHGHTVYSRHNTPDDGVSMVRGRQTTSASKIRMLNSLQIAFAGRQVIVTDKFTYTCLQSFENKGNGKAEAAEGMYDDPVIALALAYSELLRYGGITLEIPEETVGGQRMVALRKEEDLKPHQLAEVLSVQMIGPMWDDSSGEGRMTDEFRHMRPSRVRQSVKHR